MLAKVSPPLHMMIHVKCWRDILAGMGMLTNVMATIIQSSLSDS